MFNRLATLVLGLLLIAGSALATENSLTHGPIIGGVTQDSARFALRTESAGDVLIQLSTDAGDFSAPISSTAAQTGSAADFFITVQVEGLQPLTPYWFRVVLDGEPLAVQGPFRTFPEPGSTPTSFSFGFGSCQQAVTDDQSWDGAIWPLVDAADLRFFLQTGDWGYPDYAWEVPNGFPPYFHQISGQLEESYKVKYDPTYPMHEIFDTVPVDYVYDDHDYTHNNSDGSYPDKMLSVQAYQDYFPGYELANEDTGIHHSFVYGNCEFFVVDNRTQRDPNIFAFPNFMDWLADPETPLYYAPDPATHRLWDADQKQWLMDSLAASDATWKFIVSTMPWNPGHRAGVELACALQGNPAYDPIPTPGGIYTAAEVAVEFSDGGAGFPFDMAEIRGFVAANGIENVILLSGDSHTACIDDGANSPFPEWMAGGLDRTNAEIVNLQEQFGIFTWSGTGQHNGQSNFDEHYGKITVQGDESVTVEIFDTAGELIATDTVTAGFLPDTVNMTVAPQGAFYEDVSAGEMDTRPVFLINTGADDLVVSNLVGLDFPFQIYGLTPDFQIDPGFTLPVSIPAGQKQALAVVFTPQEAGVYSDTLLVIGNDPQGPAGIVVTGVASGTVGTDPVEEIDPNSTPAMLTLSQNHPNPFNPMTTIAYSLPEAGRVLLEVYDMRGHRVNTLVNELREAGEHQVVFDGQELPSGTYFVKLQGETFVRTSKMQLVK